jgi:hypothetical protein
MIGPGWSISVDICFTRRSRKTDCTSGSTGGVVTLKRAWRDGATRLVFEPLEFLAKLAALMPRPEINLVLHHGVLAPHARWRTRAIGYCRPIAEVAALEPTSRDSGSAGVQESCQDLFMRRRLHDTMPTTVKKSRLKNPHAVALGRLGAQKGASKAGIARWAKVPPEERQELARRAALARWHRKGAS